MAGLRFSIALTMWRARERERERECNIIIFTAYCWDSLHLDIEKLLSIGDVVIPSEVFIRVRDPTDCTDWIGVLKIIHKNNRWMAS